MHVSVFSVNASAPCPRALVQVKKKLDGVKGEIRKRERAAKHYVETSSGRGDVAVTGHEELDEAVNIFIYITYIYIKTIRLPFVYMQFKVFMYMLLYFLYVAFSIFIHVYK